jgi:hypothetical protein
MTDQTEPAWVVVPDDHMLSVRYAEFTATLRECATSQTRPAPQVLRDAANTIDELVAKIAQLQAPIARQ